MKRKLRESGFTRKARIVLHLTDHLRKRLPAALNHQLYPFVSSYRVCDQFFETPERKTRSECYLDMKIQRDIEIAYALVFLFDVQISSNAAYLQDSVTFPDVLDGACYQANVKPAS